MKLIDTIHGVVARRIVPLHTLEKLPAVKENEMVMKLNEGFRQRLKRASISNGSLAIQKWGELFQCPILQYEYTVPRKALLKEWGLYNECLKNKTPTHDIKVYIRLPAFILSSYKHDTTKKMNEFGCIDLKELDLTMLPVGTPFVIHFHGGGMTIGAHSDGVGLRLIQKVSKLTSEAIIHASVSYSQAPEYLFPVPVEEALTVTSHFLDVLHDRRLHIAGISAGGNLASVATMEMHRRNPGRVSSSLIVCPMLDPAANSQSHYINGDTSYVPSSWLRWCWRAYLAMPHVEETDESEETMYRGNRLDTNEHAWRNSSWSKGSLARFVNPTWDVPNGLNHPDAPVIILTTNEADPLRDDGILLAQELINSGARIDYMRHSGSHWNGTAVDKKSYANLILNWSKLLFPDEVQAKPSTRTE